MYTGEAYATPDVIPVETDYVPGEWSHVPFNAPVSISVPTGLLRKASDHNMWVRLAEALTGIAIIAIAYTAITGHGKLGKVTNG
jgi:hypothetical protein